MTNQVSNALPGGPHDPSCVVAAALAVAVLVPAAPAAATVTSTDLLSVQGAGPYRIGTRQQALADAGLLSWTVARPGCAIVDAGATGDWAGVVLLAFRNGRLVEVGTATTPPRTPSGGSVGMSWAQLEETYGSRGRLIHNSEGDPAYVVRIGARVELFTGHPIRQGAGYLQVGPANYVLHNLRHGPAC